MLLGLKYHLIARRQALAKALRRGPCHVNAVRRSKPAVFPEHHLPESSLDIDANHPSHSHRVNGPRNLLTLGRAIFPTWRGRRSAVCLISASVFRGSTTALDRGGRGRWLDQSIGADVLRNEIGVLTEAIA